MPPRSEPERVLAALLALPRRRRGGRRRGGGPIDRYWLEGLERFEAAAGEIARRVRRPDARPRRRAGLLRFDGPGRAGRAAIALRAAAAAARLPLAQGLHVGEVELRGEPGRHAGAGRRGGSPAWRGPGEILGSALVAELTAGSGMHFAEAGALAVEGVERPIRLVALVSRTAPRPGGPRAARARSRAPLAAASARCWRWWPRASATPAIAAGSA